MKSSDRMIVLGVAILGLAAAFWFLILSPKREEASELQTQVTELESQVVTAEQAAATGEVAKKDFSHNYRQADLARQGGPGGRRHARAC